MLWLIFLGVILFGAFMVFLMISTGAPLIVVEILIGGFLFTAAAAALIISVLRSNSPAFKSESTSATAQNAPKPKDYFTGVFLILLGLFLGWGFWPSSTFDRRNILGICIALIFIIFGILWFKKTKPANVLSDSSKQFKSPK